MRQIVINASKDCHLKSGMRHDPRPTMEEEDFAVKSISNKNSTYPGAETPFG